MARWSMVKYARTGDGAHLAFQEGGSGPPLLLFIEGFVSIEDMDDEPRLAHALERRTRFSRAIRFDRRGIGLSDRSPLATQPNLDQWLDDALAVLDAAEVEKAILFGDRGGALLALGFAARHPERVQRLVLVNGYATFMAGDDHPAGADLAFMATVRERMFDPMHPDGPFDIITHLAPSAADDVRFRARWDRAGRRGRALKPPARCGRSSRLSTSATSSAMSTPRRS